MVKKQPAMQQKKGTRVGSLGEEEPLEEEKTTPALLPGESHRQRSLVATVHGVARRIGHDLVTN